MTPEGPVSDITIIGGGPIGLFAAFYAGLREMTTRIIDSLDHLGGQLTTLYPDKFIYDAPGHPNVLAKTLVGELVRQAMQYHPSVVLGERVERITRRSDATIELRTDRGPHLTRTVLIAVGGGAFVPTRLPNADCRQFERRGVEYFLMDLMSYKKKQVLVIGGGDAAVDRALMLERIGARVTLIHRAGNLRAAEGAVARLSESGVTVRPFHRLKGLSGKDGVENAVVEDIRTQREETLPMDAVLVSAGFTSTLAPAHEWGVSMTPDGIAVTGRMETNLPGVFAAGDIVTYPGKLKLIATGFGEAAIAVNHAKVCLDPRCDLDPGHSTSIVPRQREARRQGAAESSDPTEQA